MLNRIKVLLVEDDPLIGDMIQEDLLEAFPNGEIRLFGPASSFKEGLELLDSEMPDIALLDIELHEDKTAGIRLAQYINQTMSIPVVFLSGLPKESGFDIAKLTMPYAFLRKPYRSQDLKDQIELLVIRESQRKSILKEQTSELVKIDSSIHNSSIFVITGHGERTALSVEDLILLEADDKIIRAYFLSKEQPIFFNSPGLKNFFDDNKSKLEKKFFQLNRKYVINFNKILSIKNNHVVLPKFSKEHGQKDFFTLPIPQNGDKRKELFNKLGLED